MRAPKRRKPAFSLTITAALNGTPWPENPSRFDSHKIENPDSHGLVGLTEHAWSFSSAWRQFHGREMTSADKFELRRRLPALKAKIEGTTTKPARSRS